jgi:hypothetical protein
VLSTPRLTPDAWPDTTQALLRARARYLTQPAPATPSPRPTGSPS